MHSEVYTLKTGDLREDQPEEDKYSVLIMNVYNCLNEQLLLLMTQMLTGAEDYLSALAKNAGSDELKSRYAETIRLLSNKCSDIDKSFFLALNDHLNPASSSSNTNEEDELCLVDEDEMEEMIAMTTIHSNAMNEFGCEIALLHDHLEYLQNKSVPIFEKESLNPHQICEVFQKVLKKNEVNTGIRYVLLQILDKDVISKLGSVYTALNKLFIDEGILLKKKYKNPVSDSEKQDVLIRTATYYDPQENKATNFIPRSQEEINYLVMKFMSDGVVKPGPGIPNSFTVIPPKGERDGKKYYARSDVTKALTNLQNSLIEDTKEEHVSTEEIKRNITSDIAKENEGAVTKQVHLLDERSIDLVGMMFNAITEDNSISDVIKDLLMRLQIPVIKVAMLDKDLFVKNDHPTRNVLDLVSVAGKSVLEREDRLFNELECIVDNILHEYDIDIASFETAVDELKKLIKTEQTLAEKKEKEEQFVIFKAQAREVVVSEFRQISRNKKVPSVVKPLVYKQWPTLMMNRYLKNGKNSNQWVQSIMLLKLLLRCLQPVQKDSQWNLLKNNHLALIEAVNDELYDTDQDRKVIDNQVLMLKTIFQKMLDNYGFTLLEETQDGSLKPMEDLSNEDAENYVTEETGEDILERIDNEAKINKEKIDKLLNDVRPGVWFEIFNGEDHPIRRLKLSVILTEVAKLIFVDRRGVKVIEKDIEEFTRELESNKSRMLADHSTFDHVLGKVINALAA